MILLRRYRVSRYVRKGIMRELAFEDWTDDDGVIHKTFSVRELWPVSDQNSTGRNRAAYARLESQLVRRTL